MACRDKGGRSVSAENVETSNCVRGVTGSQQGGEVGDHAPCIQSMIDEELFAGSVQSCCRRMCQTNL